MMLRMVTEVQHTQHCGKLVLGLAIKRQTLSLSPLMWITILQPVNQLR